MYITFVSLVFLQIYHTLDWTDLPRLDYIYTYLRVPLFSLVWVGLLLFSRRAQKRYQVGGLHLGRDREGGICEHAFFIFSAMRFLYMRGAPVGYIIYISS